MSNTIPKQSLAFNEKTEEWQKQCVEAYIKRTNYKVGGTDRKHELLKLYDYYNGKTYEEDYRYVLEPFGGKQISNFPAQMRTFPLIKPAVDLLLGEKLKRPFNFSVIISNPDVVTIKEEAKKEAVLENMYQWFINALNDEGVDTGMESEEVELPEHVEKIFERNWKDHRAIMAQNALRYLIPYLHWKEQHQKGFFDWLVSGMVVSHKGIINNEPYYEILNPLEADWDSDPNVEFIEDGNWVVIKELASRASIIDKFHKYLTDVQVERLEKPSKSNRDDLFWYNSDENIFYDEWDEYAEVCTVYWKSLKKIGYRAYRDEYGDILEEVVDENYEFNPQTDIDIEWSWVNEVWQGHRLDGDIYINIQPYPMQRPSIDNPSKVKLPVNGRRYSSRNSRNVSFVMLGIPFQIIYDIYKYRLEAAIAKSRDMLALFDINMIPEGWSMDKFMAVLEATGIAWVDYAKEGLQFNPQHQAVLDLSIKTVTQYLELLNYIKTEWEQISGVTRQRMGETSPYELKSTTEQSIIQSSHITEDMFRKYNFFEERDLQGLLEIAQLAWIDGKKAMFMQPDGSPQYLELDEEFTLAEYGIFVQDSNKETEKLDTMRQLTSVALEQGASLSTIADIVDSESFIEIKDKIKQHEEIIAEREQAMKEQEEQMLQMSEESKQNERDHEEKLKVMELNNKIELEYVKRGLQETTDDSWKEQLEERKMELERQIKNRDLAEKERNNKAKEEIERRKINKMNTKK